MDEQDSSFTPGLRDLGDIILISDDPVAKSEKSGWDSFTLQGSTATVAAGLARFLPFAATGMTLGPLIALAAPAVLMAFKGPSNNDGSQPICTVVAASDIVQLTSRDCLFFPSGGPMLNGLYARHPLRPRDYIPYARFHRTVLREKAIEVARYLLALRAEEIRIVCAFVSGNSADAKATVPLPDGPEVSASMGMRRDNDGNLSILVTGAGEGLPVPDDLIWPGRDPLFKLVRDAAQAGALTLDFGIADTETVSVNASASVKFGSLGVDLGGKYKRWEDLSLNVETRFGRAAKDTTTTSMP